MALPGPEQYTAHQIPCLGHPKHQRSSPEAKARPRTSTYIVGILGRHRDGHGDAGNRDTDAHSGPDTATKHAQAASRHTSDRFQHSSAPMPTRAPGQTHKSRHTRAIPSNRRPQRHGRQQNLERGGTGAQSARRRPAPVGVGHRQPRHPRALLWRLASMYLPRLGRWCRRGRGRRCSCGFHEHGQRLLGVVSSVDDLLDLGDTPPRRLRLVVARADRVPAPMLLLWPITVFSTQCRRRPSPRDAAPATIHCRRM